MASTWRIREQSAFAELRRRGRRARSGPVSVTWITGPSATPPTVGYAIGKVVGGAVVRNRVRRRLQAVVASLAAELGPGTYLIGAGAAAAGASHAELATWLTRALRGLPDPGGLRPPALAGLAGAA